MARSTIWGIHAGKTGDAHKIFLSQDVVALGWTAMGDLSKLPPNRSGFKKAYAAAYPDAKKGAIPLSAGQLFRFVHEMQIGDLVAYPSKSDHRIHIAKVTGNYFFSDNHKRSYPHQRRVEWLRDFERSDFSQEALYEIGSAMSLFQINNYADEFLTALSSSAAQKPTAKIETDSNASVAIEQSKKAIVLGKSDKARIFCNTCRHYTIHELLYSYEPEMLDFLDADIAETSQTSAKLWVCRGCEHITLQEIALDEDQVELGSEFYPSLEKLHLKPKSYIQLDSKLAQMYAEVITCFNNEAQILCAAGLRALLEGICVDKNISGRSLYHKINNLSERLPENIVQGLHWFRSIGNEAVHKLDAPSTESLRLGVTVIEALLDYFYKLDILITGLNEDVGVTSVTVEQIGPDDKTIRRIIERNPSIPFGQKDLYRVLYQAGDTGLEYEAIAEAMHNRTTAQLSGVLGALGRRINATAGVEGKPGINYLLEIVRGFDDDPSAWGWRMRPETRQVIKNSNYSWAKDWI